MDRREALKALIALPAVKAIAVAEVKPADVIVVECDKPISAVTVGQIEEHLRQVWPGRKIVVLGDGLHLHIARETT